MVTDNIPGFRKLFFYFLLLSNLGSCHCDDLPCQTIESPYSDWLSYNLADSIRFKNDNGDELSFGVNYHDISSSVTNCYSMNEYGCKCNECPIPMISIRATCKDTSRSVTVQGTTFPYSTLKALVAKYQTQTDTVELIYGIFDHSNSIKIGPQLQINSGDSLLTTFVAGNVSYNNVIFHEVDTTTTAGYIWKTYYSKGHGLIAFYDLFTNSLFYRH